MAKFQVPLEHDPDDGLEQRRGGQRTLVGPEALPRPLGQELNMYKVHNFTFSSLLNDIVYQNGLNANLCRIDGVGFGDRNLVALEADLVQERADLSELGVAGLEVALLKMERACHFSQLSRMRRMNPP